MSEAKKPIRTIIDKENGHVVGYACGNCGSFYSAIAVVFGVSGDETAKKQAEACCTPVKCADCGAEVDRQYRTICAACETKRDEVRREEDRKKELARFEKAKKVPLAQYAGSEMLHFPDCSIGNDGFIFADEVEDVFADDEMPEYAWACTSFGLGIEANDVIDQALENHHEDAGDQIGPEARKELQTLLDDWCVKHNVLSYEPDNDLAVVLREPPAETTPEKGGTP